MVNLHLFFTHCSRPIKKQAPNGTCFDLEIPKDDLSFHLHFDVVDLAVADEEAAAGIGIQGIREFGVRSVGEVNGEV